MRSILTLLLLGLVGLSLGCGSYEGRASTDNAVAFGRFNSITAQNSSVSMFGAANLGLSWDFLKCGAFFPTGDPGVQYDNAADRYFWTVMGGPHGGVILSIAPGTDPTHPTTCYALDGLGLFFRQPLSSFCSTPGNCFVDLPRLSVSSNKITITATPFGSTDESTTLVINKDDAVSAQTLHTATIPHKATGFHPAKNVTGEAYVLIFGLPSGTPARTVRIDMISGVPGVGNGVTHASHDVTASFDTGSPPGMGFDAGGDAWNDLREPPFFHGTLVNGILWTLTRADQSGQGRYALTNFYNISPTFSPKEFATAFVGPPIPGATAIACGGLAATIDQDVVVSFVTVSPTTWLSLWATGRRAYDPPLTLRAPTLIQEGLRYIYAGSPPRNNRLDWCEGVTGPDGRSVLMVGPFSNTYGFEAHVFPVKPSTIP